MNTPIQAFPNVCFVSDHTTFAYEDLCETKYIESILQELSERMGSAFATYTFYLYANPTPAKGEATIQSAIADDKRAVVLYLSDETSFVPEALAEKAFAVFKQYLKEIPTGNIYPLPLGHTNALTPGENKDTANRLINVFFSGALHNRRIEFYQSLGLNRYIPKRVFHRIMPRLSKRQDKAFPNAWIRFSHAFMEGLDGAQYSAKLHDSKIALCPPGYISEETFRHTEAMKAGCIVISTQLPNTWIYAGSPIQVVANWQEARAFILGLLHDPERMQDLQEKTRTWWTTRCSPEAVATYMQETLQTRQAAL